MKKLALLLLFLPFVMSCSSVSNHSEENLALIEKYVQAVENLDHDMMASLLDENYLGLGPSYGDSIRKEQAVENWKYNVDNLYEKIDYTRSRNAAITITSGENQGEWISNWAELFITYKDNRGTGPLDSVLFRAWPRIDRRRHCRAALASGERGRK
jgi:hypothetical protein